jgi:osmotically-inducible protein OsmY
MYPTVEQVHDDELHRRIIGTLTGRGPWRLGPRQVTTTAGVATVRGRFASERDKLMCLEFCRHVAGVVRVVDNTHVGMSDDGVIRRSSSGAVDGGRIVICGCQEM